MNDDALVTLFELDTNKTWESQAKSRVIIDTIINIVAFAIRTMEFLFDSHTAEVTALLEAMRPHTCKWYHTKTLAFRYGQDLVEDADYYSDDDLTDEEIAASMIVAQASVVQSGTILQIKAVKSTDDVWGALEPDELTALSVYINRVKDAGVQVTVASYDANVLKIVATIYYDPMLMNADGELLTDGSAPVTDAINSYLKSLPFDGTLTVSALTDALQTVKGVKVPDVQSLWYEYGTDNWLQINAIYHPTSGWIEFDEENSTISYQPYV